MTTKTKKANEIASKSALDSTDFLLLESASGMKKISKGNLFNAIPIGGRNYIRYFKDDGSNNVSDFGASLKQDSFGVYKAYATNPYSRISFLSPALVGNLEIGSNYVVSFKIKADSSRTIQMLWGIDDAQNNIGSKSMEISTEVKRIVLKYTAVKQLVNGGGITIYISDKASVADSSRWIEISEVKLEKGEIASDWTLAQEDIIAICKNNIALSSLNLNNMQVTDFQDKNGGGGI